MLLDVKAVLEKLNSALTDLTRRGEEAAKETEEAKLLKMKLSEQEAKLKAQADNLNAREIKVKEVESVVDFAGQAKKLMTEARVSMDNANERQAKLEAGFKKLADDQAKLEKAKADFTLEQEKEIKAIKQERTELEAKLKTLRELKVKI